MKNKTMKEIWESLSPEQKNQLADRADTTYGALKFAVCKSRFGFKMRYCLYAALLEMRLIDARMKPETVKRQLFDEPKNKAA